MTTPARIAKAQRMKLPLILTILGVIGLLVAEFCHSMRTVLGIAREWLGRPLDWLADRAAARRTDVLSAASMARVIEAAVAKVEREKAR